MTSYGTSGGRTGPSLGGTPRAPQPYTTYPTAPASSIAPPATSIDNHGRDMGRGWQMATRSTDYRPQSQPPAGYYGAPPAPMAPGTTPTPLPLPPQVEVAV